MCSLSSELAIDSTVSYACGIPASKYLRQTATVTRQHAAITRLHVRHGYINPDPQRRQLALQNSGDVFHIWREILALQRHELVCGVADGDEDLVSAAAESVGFKGNAAAKMLGMRG